MKYKIYIEREMDREHVVCILTRNGYIVRQGKEKQGTKNVCFVEYWEQEAL